MICFANSGEPDQTLYSAASYLSLHCLPMSHKKEIMLIWVIIKWFHWIKTQHKIELISSMMNQSQWDGSDEVQWP